MGVAPAAALSGRGAPPRAALGQVVEAISTTSAVIMNDRSGILAWTPLAAALIAEFPGCRRMSGTLWASHHVHEKTHGHKRFRHPAVGEVALDHQTFRVSGTDHHLLVISTAVPGSYAVARRPPPAQR